MTLSTSNITMQFAGKPLFENISVKFISGCCYGLIGANGSGKTTFLKILSGELESSGGTVSHDTHERMSVLKQNQFAYEDQIVLSVVMQGHQRLWAILQEKNAIYDNPEATESDYMRASELETEFGELDGYSAEAKAGELLLGLGIDLSYHAGVMSLVPPGLKIRVLLAQALFADPDILLLDEPTNNLDIDTIRWLENTLRTGQATMVVISHDRHFLNAVCTHMADMDYGTLRIYPGNYDSYMEASFLARQRVLAANAKATNKIAELQDFVRRFSANKSKARQATSRMKQIEKLKVEEVKPSSRQHPFIRFEEKKKLFRSVLEVNRLSKSFDRPLIHRFKAVVESGERIAVIGQNGVGKTTLLKMLAGCLSPDEGHIRWSENAQLGYYPQDTAACFEEDMTLMDWLLQFKPVEEDPQIIRSVLGRLLFSGDDANKSVRVLSGGERGRMLYGQLILEKPNVILMDEPTNHMDMETIESLNIALEKYPGTVIFVSHDREFVSSLATRIWAVKSDQIVDFSGDYDSYLVSQGLE